ncbi:MAG: TonB-dependent receptor [Bryobacteraceae bacterium]|nr:TonB-dependent receptor [Bryobacteraceae bacterium]
MSLIYRFAFTLLALSGLLCAQSAEATISGFITDQTGAAVVGAAVSAANTATGQRSQSAADENGFYTLRALPIGTYIISIEKPGFRKYIRENLVLTTGQQLTLDVKLEVGALTESVTVSAQASLLETRTSEQSQLVEARNIADMPLGDRRTMNIIQMTGTAVFINYDSGGKPNFSLAGGRTQSQNFYMDGGTIQNMRLGIGQVDTDPPVETVAEVKVLSNSFSAEYGGSAGGVIVATTKSGTNQLRGSAYEYLRNEKLDAGNFFAPFVNGEKVRAPLRYNVYGTTVGGPVKIPKLYDGKDRTFWYFAWEGSRRSQGRTDQFTVPDALQRAGDFSQTYAANGSVIPIYDPSTTRVEGGRNVRTQFPGNVIPASRIDPVGKALIPFYPNPNRPPDNITGANNFRTNYTEKLTRDAFLVKGDHAISDKDRISMRYLYNSDDLDYTTVMADIAAENRVPARRHQHFFYGTYTRVFSPSIINEFRFNYGNRINHTVSYGIGGDWPTKLGLKGVPTDAFPTFNVTGMRTMGAGNHERRQFPIQQFMWSNNLSVIRGRHAFKFGFEYRPSYNYEINRPSVSGNFTMSPLTTGQPGVASSGFGVASLLVGAPLSMNVRETEVLDRQSNYIAFFAQDDWTVTKDLTLNFGIRWETDTPIKDYSNRMNGFDQTAINPVSGTPGVIKFMGVDGFRTTPYDTDYNNFGPRFGFAWKPGGDGKTVIRGGFGTFFAHPFDAGAPSSASLGFELSATIA